MEPIRLNKYLAECGVCSRREADRLMERGAVTVNGLPAKAGVRVTASDRIEVNGRVLEGREKTVVLAFYKPVGVVCTERDRHAQRIISDLLRYPVRVTYAGRLDKDSEGLLLMTNDGELIEAMMRGSNRHEKEYVVKADKTITDGFLEKMRSGVFLKELNVTTRPCAAEAIGDRTFRIILTQGLNRQIRRMCQALGYEVRSLKRIRVMNVELGKLKGGCYREVTGEELHQLYRMAGIRRKCEGNEDILRR